MITNAQALAIIKAAPRGCTTAGLMAETLNPSAGPIMRALLELIADGEVEALWRDPEHRTGLMFRAVDR